ncbi:MAG: Fic family protein [Bacteriovoracaceae bacterium]|nr:Fic family protein [Bacteriovoracaceae bacterium]
MSDHRDLVLQFIKDHPQTNRKAIAEFVAVHADQKVSIPTISRDLEALVVAGKIVKAGQARATTYAAAVDLDAYFSRGPDERMLVSEYFNFEVWQRLKDLFSPTELAAIDRLNQTYRKNKTTLSKTLYKKEIERLTIEFSWKSSRIEGNTYNLLDTERLIREREEAAGKSKDEAIMILNHKAALDFIFTDPGYFKKISLSKIEYLHRLLTSGLGVSSGVRQRQVAILGTKYRPLDNQHQIHEALENLVSVINKTAHPLAKALLAVLMISYIQPFEDGNKRTARTLGNALLLAFDYCPLSYRSADENEYKKGIILFYEQNDLSYFKKIFVDQFKFGVKNYFQ